MVEISERGLNTIIADFGDASRRAGRASVRALNRAIASGRTVMVRAVAGDTGLSATAVRKAIVLREATFARPTASIAATLKRIPLIEFNARGQYPSRGKGRGVSYRIGTGGIARTNAGIRERLPNAFIATMRSGHVGVFQRSGKGRLPIHEKFGPSIGHVFAKHRPEGMARVREAFEQNFAHELEYARTE